MSAADRPQLRLAPSREKAHIEDRALAEALIAGQAWAATAVYRKHGRMVFRFLDRALGLSGEAEDLTQEVFLQVFSKVRDLRDPGALKSFVFSVAVRVLKWELRSRRTRRFFLVLGFDPFPEPTVSEIDAESRQAISRLYAILDRLRVQERIAFVLRHVEQLKLEEIGDALGVSLATVKRRLERATKVVSREMEQDPTLAPYTKKVIEKSRASAQVSRTGSTA
jgi:RNA polymerase sigma-70 factor (ECF subfamily)